MVSTKNLVTPVPSPSTRKPAATPPVPATHEPLRICMMVTYDLASPGGVKHHAQQLAAALRRRGDQVTLVGPSSKPSDDPHTKTFSGVLNIPANGSDNMLGIFV